MSDFIVRRLAQEKHQNSVLRERVENLNDDLTAAMAEIERLRGRVAMLEEFAADAQMDACRALDPDYVPPAVESAMNALLHRAATITQEIDPDDIEPSSWLLRKQAEAVEQARDEICNRAGSPSWHSIELTDYAQVLRQQATENGEVK